MSITALSSLKLAAWNGIEFPVKRYSVKGSLQHHVHKYPHAKGGAFENLERNLYEIRMSAFFLEHLGLYPDLWPLKLSKLRESFESGNRGRLHIPTIGTMDARCINWTQELDVKIQSGEMVELEFLEDESQDFLIDAVVSAGTRASDLIGSLTNEAARSQMAEKLGYVPDIFQSITNAANEVFAIKDFTDVTGAWVESKIRGLDALIRQADETVVELQDYRNSNVLQAMRDLWLSLDKLSKDVQGKGSEILTWVVPTAMTIAQVSTAIYGDATHAIDLLQINSVQDALSVPAGTVINYYEIKA
jgi:prophage DNA circulation protein